MSGKLSKAERASLGRFIKEGPKNFQLLYSFSQDGADATTFHNNCNNKGPTVTVIYDTVGSVYGGYTAISWSSSKSYYSDKDAFLFRLRLKGKEAITKFPVKSADNAIYCCSSYGPTFGSGHDLYTFHGSISPENNIWSLNVGASFGCSFDMAGVSTDQIAGNVKTVTDLEVYSVSDATVVTAWREIEALGEWNISNLQSLKGEIENYCPPQVTGATTSRILFLGPVGAGKSSFFNTIASVFRGHVTGQAVCGLAEQCVTSKFRIYCVRGSSQTKPLKFRLCDTRGIEENQGIDGTELDYLLEGNVPDGYKFNPSLSISPKSQDFLSSTSLDSKIHCVCFVIDGSTASDLSDKLLEKIKSLQMAVRQKEIPQVILLTKVDKVCQYVEEDVTLTFCSEAIRNLVDKFSDMFGVPRSHVLPVKNYEKEIDVRTDVSILALIALRQILRSSEDFLFNFINEEERFRMA